MEAFIVLLLITIKNKRFWQIKL